MSHGAVDQAPEVGTPERSSSLAVTRHCYGGCSDDIIVRTGYITATGISLPGASTGNWPRGASCRTFYTGNIQDPWRRHSPIARLFCRERVDAERDCDACSESVSIRRASAQQAWLTAAAEKSAPYWWNILLTACNPASYSKPTNCLSRITCARPVDQQN